MALLRGREFPVPEALLAHIKTMRAGQPVTATAGYVPKWARRRLGPGRPMLIAEVYPDDTVMFGGLSAAEWLAEHGL